MQLFALIKLLGCYVFALKEFIRCYEMKVAKLIAVIAVILSKKFRFNWIFAVNVRLFSVKV